MLYNKNQFKKVNDKKVLHKIKKHWVTVSIAMLGLIGGGAVAFTNASANATNQSNNDTQANHSLNVNQQNRPKLVNNNSQANYSSQFNNGIHNKQTDQSRSSSNSLNTQTITDQAIQLHKNIVNHALTNSKEQMPSPNNHLLGNQIAEAPSIVKTGKWNDVNVNYLSNDTMELTGNGSIDAINVPNLPFNSDHTDWTLKIDPTSHVALNESKQAFSAKFFPLWHQFRTMDLNGLNIQNVTDMHGMFQSDSYLRNLDLTNWNTDYVSDMSSMFQSDYSLSSLNLNNFNTSHVTNMSNMFTNDSMKYLNLGNFDTGNVTNMGNMNVSCASHLILGNKTNLSKYFNTLYNLTPYYLDKSGKNVTSAVISGKQPAGQYETAFAPVIRLYPSNNYDNVINTNKKILMPLQYNVNTYPHFNLSSDDLEKAGIDLSGYKLAKPSSSFDQTYENYTFISGNTGTIGVSIRPNNSYINIQSLRFINSKNHFLNNDEVSLHLPDNKYAINDTLNKLDLPKGYQLNQVANQNYSIHNNNGKNYLNVRVIPIYKDVDIHLVDQHGESMDDYKLVKVPANSHVFNEYHDDVVNEVKKVIPYYRLRGTDTQNCIANPDNYIDVNIIIPDSAMNSSSSMISPHKASVIPTSSSKSMSTTSSASSHTSIPNVSSANSKVSHNSSASSVKPTSKSQSTNSNAKSKSIASSISNKPSSVNSSTTSSVSSNSVKSGSNHKSTSSANTIKTGTYDGLTYKYDPTSKTVEFTGGTANSNLSYFIKNAPYYIKNASSIVFTTLGDANNSDDLMTSDVTNMNHMFASDTKLKSLYLGNGFTTKNVTNMNSMFNNDNNLQTLVINSSVNPSDIKFTNSANLKPLYLKDTSDNYTSPYASNFSHGVISNRTFLSHKNVHSGTYDGLHYEYDANSKIVEFTGGTLNWDGSNNHAFIGTSDNAPSNIHNAEHINFDKGINMNNVTSLHNMFLGNTNVQSIDLSKLDTNHVTNMSNMFESDSSLNSLNLNHVNTSNVTNMNYMFSGTSNLNSLNLTSFNTDKASMTNFFGPIDNVNYRLPTILTIGPLTTFKKNVFSFNTITNLNTSSDFYYNPQNNNPDIFNNVSGSNDSDYIKTVTPNLSIGSVSLNNTDDVLMDKNGDNVTSKFKNGTESQGTYYIAQPVAVGLNNQNNQMYFIQNSVIIPLLYNNKNVSNFKYNDVVDKQMSNIINTVPIFNNDFSLDKSQNYMPITYSDSYVSDAIIKVNVHENYKKFIQDAFTKVNSDLTDAKQYQLSDISSYIDDIKNDVTQVQHCLTEPANWNTVKNTGNTENDANNKLSHIINKALNNINSDYSNIAGKYGYKDNINNILNRKDVRADSNATSGINIDKRIAQQATSTVSKDASNPTMSNVNNAKYEDSQARAALMNAYNLESDASQITPNSSTSASSNTNSSSITSTIRADYEREFSDGTRDFNDLNQDIKVYDNVCADYNNMTVNSDFIPSDLSSLSTQNSSLINDEYSVEQDYANNSNAISSLMAQLKSSSTSTNRKLTMTRPKLLLGAMASTPLSNNGFTSNVAKLSSLAMNTSEIAEKASNTSVTSYASELQSMNTLAQRDSANYSNDISTENSYNVQAGSAKNVASSLNNEIKSADLSSMEILGNKANRAEALMHSYMVNGNNQNSSAMSLTASVATELSQANSIYSNVTSVEPNIKPLSSTSTSSSNSNSSASAGSSSNNSTLTINPSFENSVNDEAKSITDATNNIANADKATSNASSANSYANDNRNLSVAIRSLANIYTGNEIIQSLAPATAVSASKAGDLYASEEKSAESQSNNSLAGSLQGEATNEKLMAVNNRVKARSASANMKSLASKVVSDMSLANVNYQDAKGLITSSSANNQSSSTSSSSLNASKSANASASTSASLSASTTNSLKKSASLSKSTSASTSASISISTSDAKSASQSISASISASVSTARTHNSTNSASRASQSVSHSTSNISSVLDNDASVLNSYNQKNNSYANTVLLDLSSLNVSGNPTLSYAKDHISEYSSRIASFINRNSDEVDNLYNQSNYSDSINNASNISMANRDISQASTVASKASSAIAEYIEPLEKQSSASTSSFQSSQTHSVSNSSTSYDNASASNSSLTSNGSNTSVSSSASRSNSIQSSNASYQSAQFNNTNASTSGNSNMVNPFISSVAQNNNTNFISQNNSRFSSNSISSSGSTSYESPTTSNNNDNPMYSGNNRTSNIARGHSINKVSNKRFAIKNNSSNMSSNQGESTNEPGKTSTKSTNQKSSSITNNSDKNSDEDDNQESNSGSDQSSDTNVNNPQQMSAKGIQSKQQKGLSHNVTPKINNNPVNATNELIINHNNLSKLPQTNENSTKSKELAEISLIMSATLGGLAEFIDEHRDDY